MHLERVEGKTELRRSNWRRVRVGCTYTLLTTEGLSRCVMYRSNPMMRPACTLAEGVPQPSGQ